MKDWLNKAGVKLQKFMYGRYGIDQLYRFLLWVYIALIIVLSIVGRFVNHTTYSILSIIPLIFLVYILYRPFSKNIAKRRTENESYLKFVGKVKAQFKFISNKWKFRKTHTLKKCPKCRAVLRFKKKKGNHTVVCPYCSTKFKFKTYYNSKE